MRRALLMLLLLLSHSAYAKEWKDGRYEYTMVFDEWGPGVLEGHCFVIIKGDSITVIEDSGQGIDSAENGTIMDRGKIMKHKKTGKWIIADSPADVNEEDIGGCTDGPTIIEFDNRIFHAC
jgi:hypothetical protein